MKVLIFLAALTACALSLRIGGNGPSCKKNSDCEESQCCVDNSRWMIASKRDVVGGPSLFPFDVQGGTCVNYVKEGASCHYLGFTSCGCEPGTSCVYHPKEGLELPKLKPVGKRSMIFRPGDSFCEAKKSD